MAKAATKQPAPAKAKKPLVKRVAKALKSKRGNAVRVDVVAKPKPKTKTLRSPAKKKNLRPAKPSNYRGGRPAWQPTADELRLVEHYTAIGMTQDEIALVMEVSVDSLQRHCRHQLDAGRLKVNAKVAAKLFDKAMKGDTASIIFWMKSRAGWKERSVLEHTGPTGGPIETTAMTPKQAAEKYREKLG